MSRCFYQFSSSPPAKSFGLLLAAQVTRSVDAARGMCWMNTGVPLCFIVGRSATSRYATAARRRCLSKNAPCALAQSC